MKSGFFYLVFGIVSNNWLLGVLLIWFFIAALVIYSKPVSKQPTVPKTFFLLYLPAIIYFAFITSRMLLVWYFELTMAKDYANAILQTIYFLIQGALLTGIYVFAKAITEKRRHCAQQALNSQMETQSKPLSAFRHW